MITSPVYRAELSWSRTKGTLDRVCDDLGLEWDYDPARYVVRVWRSGWESQVAHNLEVCFGNPADLEFWVTKTVVMRMEECDIRNMLEWWIAKPCGSTWTQP